MEFGGGVPLIRPSVRTGAPSPEGKAFVWCNCRGYNNHQGSALKRGNRGTVTPLPPSAVQGNDTNGTRLPIIGNKGVLRTIGSKRTFAEPQRGVSERNRAQRGSWRGDAYFSSARKVGRRRHNTIRKTVGHRQKQNSRQQDKNSPSAEGKKKPVPAHERTKKKGPPPYGSY